MIAECTKYTLLRKAKPKYSREKLFQIKNTLSFFLLKIIVIANYGLVVFEIFYDQSAFKYNEYKGSAHNIFFDTEIRLFANRYYSPMKVFEGK